MAAIRSLLAADSKVDRTYSLRWVDASGEVHAEIEKVVQIRLKAPESF